MGVKRPNQRALLPALATVMAWHAAAVAAYVLWTLTLPHHKTDGRCEGIGWGCTPTPFDSAILAGVIVGIPMLAISFMIAVVVAIMLTRKPLRSGTLSGTAATFAAMLVTFAGRLALQALSR